MRFGGVVFSADCARVYQFVQKPPVCIKRAVCPAVRRDGCRAGKLHQRAYGFGLLALVLPQRVHLGGGRSAHHRLYVNDGVVHRARQRQADAGAVLSVRLFDDCAVSDGDVHNGVRRQPNAL